ncbi:MAG: hypothetical protein ABSC94_26625 [Polyangiaceae bacterium]|jgi:hypothetical protein
MSALAFYEASLRALRFVEARSPTLRRFGPDADARWRNFQGHLSAMDRLELLLRDADTEYPGAFGARVAFALRGLSEDDAFGPHWERLQPPEADALWRKVTAEPAPPDIPSALTSCAAAWGLSIRPQDIAPITPISQLVVAGPSAIVSVAAAFVQGSDLAWSDQVICIASPPSHRHLAALVAPLLKSPKPTRIVLPDGVPANLIADRTVVSPDADPADTAAPIRAS